MKKIKNTSAITVSAIHGLAFTVFFVLEQFLSELVYPYLEGHIPKALYIAISAVVAALLYSVTYSIIHKIYERWMLKNDSRLKIEGDWYHVHIPHYMGNEDYTQVRLSVGKTIISRDLMDFTFVGNNERCYHAEDGSLLFKTENATHWYTKATKLSDENDFDIIEIYEAKTMGNPTIKVESCPCCKTKFSSPVEITEAERFRHGIHKINIIEEGKTTYLKGEYSDCWPSLKTGEIYFYKTIEERDKKIYEFFNNAIEWRKNQNL